MSIVLALAVLISGCTTDRPGDSGETAQQPTSTYSVQSDNVPEGLRHLVPLAKKWGIGDDVERGEFIERASDADRQALMDAIAPHQNEITAWLDSFGTSPMTDEAAAFMYMQLAVEEMRPY
jgi:hypothetical protein